jgi:uncharacterized Fe-S radical SAM superfamily protein PflX
MPSNVEVPIVWNCHAYSTSPTLSLLHGVGDAFVPDLKYMSETCGRALRHPRVRHDGRAKRVQPCWNSPFP